MKKATLLITILSVLTTGTVSAKSGERATNTFEGMRIGAGISETGVEAKFKFDDPAIEGFAADFDYGDGYKFELGYDFNEVVGVGASYETNTGTITNNFFGTGNVDASTIKLSIDLGYAFYFDSFYVKPYAKLGYKFYLDDTSDWVTEEYNSDDFFYGAGLRLQYQAIYIDATIDYFSTDFSNDDETIHVVYDYTQVGVTIGYKF